MLSYLFACLVLSLCGTYLVFSLTLTCIMQSRQDQLLVKARQEQEV